MAAAQLRCLGVGDGMASADRGHSAYLYQLGGACLLIDSGEPACRNLKRAGLPCDALDAVVLSHLHADHCAGFFMLVQGFWLDKRRRPLPVFAPKDAAEPLQRMLRAGYLFNELIGYELRFKPLREGRAFSIGAARIVPHPTTHLEGLRQCFQSRYPGDYIAYSFLLEGGSRRIGHSADLGAPQDLAPLVAQPLDLLVCELAHFEAEDLFTYLQGRAIGHLALIHLGRRFWADLPGVRRLARKMLPGIRVTIPRDGDRIEL